MYTIHEYKPVSLQTPNTVLDHCLSVSGSFAIACEPRKFATIADACHWCNQNLLRYYKPNWFIVGPRGGRYDRYGIPLR